MCAARIVGASIPFTEREGRAISDTPLGLAEGREFDLIRRFVPRRAEGMRADVLVGPGDDCAVVAGDGIALSVDLSVEGVHFRRDWLEPGEVGWRAAAGALSDLAAVGARPIGVLVSLALPAEDAGDPAVAVMDGVRHAAEAVGAALLGGDVSRSPGPLVIDVTVVGECARPVLRSGASAGDEVWVTGELGAAATFVEQRLAGLEGDPAARERYAAPRPRVHEARWLAERSLPTAMIDLSDGLAGDAAHLSAASGVAVLLVPELIPVHPAARRYAISSEDALRLALAGGEDYELCFTAPVGAVPPHARAFEQAFGVRLSSVGRIGGGDGVWWVDAEAHRRPLGLAGFRHFEEAAP